VEAVLPDEPAPLLPDHLADHLADPHSDRGPTEPSPARPWTREDRKRLLLWVAIAFLIPLVFVFGFHLTTGAKTSVFRVRTELPLKAIMAFFVALATWIVSRKENRPLDDYGIPLRQAFGRRFWEGTVWGFAMLSAILLILRLSGHFQIDSVALAGSAALRSAMGWGATFLAVSLHEELAFRGYWLFLMSRRIRFWRASLFLSAVFGAAHLGNHGENILGIVQVVATGLLFCLMIRRTGNLWFAIGFHAAWDWAETFFYGTPDSGSLGMGRLLNSSAPGPGWLTGGSAGPEGSIFAMLILGLCALLIHFRFPNAIYPDRPA
jgi:membrane protease YdiL (CAAX protease family)